MNPGLRTIKIIQLLSGLTFYSVAQIQLKLGLTESKRTIERDLENLEECGIHLDISPTVGGDGPWYRIARWSTKFPPALTQNEVLTWYMLKAYLSEFRGTLIEKEAASLTNKLVEIAPGDVFLPDDRDGAIGGSDIVWDQNFGQYDYGARPDLLSEVIEAVIKPEVVSVTYQRAADTAPSTFDVYMYRLFLYRGSIYVACHMPHHNNDGALAIEGIQSIGPARQQYTNKVFGFDLDKFRQARFGVFDGPMRDVELRIRKDFVRHFENRSWHRSQQISLEPNGDMILKMRVPLSPELSSWILSWNVGLSVLGPAELKEDVQQRLRETLAQYS